MKQKFYEKEQASSSSSTNKSHMNEFASDRLRKMTRINEKYNLGNMIRLENTVGNMKSIHRDHYPEYLPERNRSAQSVEDLFPIPSLLDESMLEFLQSCRIDPVLFDLSKGADPSKKDLRPLSKIVNELLQMEPDFFKNDDDLYLARTTLYLIWFANRPYRFSVRELFGKLEKSTHSKDNTVPPKKLSYIHFVLKITAMQAEIRSMWKNYLLIF